MKKLLLLLVSAIILLTSCSNNVPILDASQSNIGSASDINRFYPVMETETGYYYNSALLDEYKFNDDVSQYTTKINVMSMRYIDKESGKEIYLCTKPECNHDGSSFCTATNREFIPLYMSLYGEVIYIVGLRNQNDRKILSLYCLNTDGSELTRLVDFFDTTKEINFALTNGGLTVHRGIALVVYNVYNEDPDSAVNGIIEIDLTTLKYKTIEEIRTDEIGIYVNVRASGDYIYYMLGNYLGKPNYLKRYDIKEKITEELPVNGLFKSYAIIGDEIYYNYLYNKIKKYNTVTGETVDFKWDSETEPENINDIMFDGEYLYVSLSGLLTAESSFMSINTEPERGIIIYIYNLDGELLGEFEHEGALFQDLNGDAIRNTINGFSFNIINGIIYYQDRYSVNSCPVSDILNGNVSWSNVYFYEN